MGVRIMSRFTKLILPTAVLSLSLVGVAAAADLRPAYKAPPPVAAPVTYSWAGFYMGVNAGGGWTEGSDAGFVGGGQIGYNWALSPNWVIGIEGDFDGTSLKDSASVIVPGGSLSASADLRWLASVRGRLGYTWDHYMLYFTGGGAWAEVKGSATATVTGIGSASAVADATASGWVIGGGGEWMFAPNWTFGIEYLHYQFDQVSGTVTGPGGGFNFNFNDTDGKVDVVRARLSYTFGDWFGKGKAPVAARY
jgi:outer membrane immunogenic protein